MIRLQTALVSQTITFLHEIFTHEEKFQLVLTISEIIRWNGRKFIRIE